MTDLYKKYSHIVPGSIEDVEKGKVIICGKNEKIVSHGRICIVKCQLEDAFHHCVKTRVINIQDASQTKLCTVCARYMRNLRRRRQRS